jgi:lycopene beta-cyclase
MLTYARFLGIFLCVPLLATLLIAPRVFSAGRHRALVALLVIVYVATSPWDNAAVAMGFWEFEDTRNWGITLGYLPLEEYLFFGLQTVLVAAWVLKRLERVS